MSADFTNGYLRSVRVKLDRILGKTRGHRSSGSRTATQVAVREFKEGEKGESARLSFEEISLITRHLRANFKPISEGEARVDDF